MMYFSKNTYLEHKRSSLVILHYMTFRPPLKELFLRGFRGKEKTF